MPRGAVVLLSGGLDSSTALYWAQSRGYAPTALTIFYGQRHERELASAKKVARAAGAPQILIRLPLPWLKASSLVDKSKALPRRTLEKIGTGPIPSTYVPGRNTVFMSLAISLADAAGAEAVVIGANALDYSGYPDCRPGYYRALEKVARLGTRRGSEGRPLKILVPLAAKDKKAIVLLARELEVPLGLTWSCYSGGKKPCGSCDSCRLRAKGFSEAGLKDPAVG